MAGRIAYLTQGRLFLKDGDGQPSPVESDFAQEAVARTQQRQQKNAWKGQVGSSLVPGSALWAMSMDDATALKIYFTGVCRGANPQEIVYSLSTSAVGGLFAFDSINQKENRQFHREGLCLTDLSKHREEDLIACSQHFPNRTACISICRGPDVQAVTEGDSIDEAPCWIPDKGKQLVFQSSGIARNADGVAVGIGPFSVQQLNLTNGEMSTVVESDKYDYLLPHILMDGTLLAIKRPYEPLGRTNYPLHKMLLDVVLFPFRVVRALFHFLNFFSLVFSKKPLTTATGQRVEGADLKQFVLRGRMIDAEKALKDKAAGNDAPPLVPSSWQLVRRKQTGEEELIASSVAAFDVDSRERIVYTNGTSIFELDGGEKPRMIGRGSLIETVVCLD